MTDTTDLADPLVDAPARAEAIAKEFEQFVYIVSHDMGAPIRHVREFTAMLVDSLSEHVSEADRKYVDFISGATDRLQGMLDGMLAYSRLNTQRREMRTTNLGPMIRQLVEQAFPSHASRIEIGELPKLPCDRTQIQSLFGNLIENALKFHEDPDTACIRIGCEERPTEWVFSVSDDGIGMEPRNHERIFDVMGRLHPESEYPGLGFGLALVRKIVQRHGGDIWVHSAPGAGSTFRFSLSKFADD